MANLCGDENMLQAYEQGRDLHTETTALLEGLGLFTKLKITHPDLKRRMAKTTNFGILYGVGAYSLAPRLGVPEAEAQRIINAFYKGYPKAKPWQQEQVAHAKKYGYVETFLGRRLYTPCALAEEGFLAVHGANQAANYPVQGGAAEIVKAAMLRAEDFLVCQVHDELLYLVPEIRKEEYEQYLAKALVDKRHRVPYTVDVHIGRTWGDIKAIPDVWEDEEE